MHEDHEKDLRAVAHITHRIRPDWATPGILTALRACPATASLADIAIAAITCARDRTDQRTPAVIALDGTHWATASIQPETPRLNPRQRCGICYRDRAGHDQAEALVPIEDRHAWITETDHRRQRTAAPRPRQEPTQ